MVNIIGRDAYYKNCPHENRSDLDVSENQAEMIAKAFQKDKINLRIIQGELVKGETSEFWYGDTLGRIAEGLSEGQIQLQKNETKKPINKGRSWTPVLTKEAKGWKSVSVAYVYLGKKPSEQLSNQALKNPKRLLMEARIRHSGQYVGLTSDLKLVVGDHQEEVVLFINGSNKVKVI